jgi:hypothetical protein
MFLRNKRLFKSLAISLTKYFNRILQVQRLKVYMMVSLTSDKLFAIRHQVTLLTFNPMKGG